MRRIQITHVQPSIHATTTHTRTSICCIWHLRATAGGIGLPTTQRTSSPFQYFQQLAANSMSRLLLRDVQECPPLPTFAQLSDVSVHGCQVQQSMNHVTFV